MRRALQSQLIVPSLGSLKGIPQCWAESCDRELIPAEQTLELTNQIAATYNVITISQVKGPLDAEQLAQALELLRQRHPRLSSVIVGRLDDLAFQQCADLQIPLRVETITNPEDWKQSVQQELNQPITSTRYLIRVVLVQHPQSQTNHLITTLHHAISDGLSSLNLHSEILSTCQYLLEGNHFQETLPVALSPLMPLPSIESLLPPSHQGFRGKLAGIALVARLKWKKLRYRPKTLPFAQTVPISERRCGWIQRQLSPDLLTQLVQRCRQEKTSVHGALSAALLRSIAQELSPELQQDLPVNFNSFTDLRRHLQPQVGHEHLGLFASVVTSWHRLKPDTYFWTLAREIKTQVEQKLAQRDMFSTLSMSRKIIEAMLRQSDTSLSTAGLTNVGRVNMPHEYGALRLENISFTSPQTAFGGILGVAVTTFRGRMQLNFAFSEPSISPATAERLADRMLSQIDQATSSPLPNSDSQPDTSHNQTTHAPNRQQASPSSSIQP